MIKIVQKSEGGGRDEGCCLEGVRDFPLASYVSRAGGDNRKRAHRIYILTVKKKLFGFSDQYGNYTL